MSRPSIDEYYLSMLPLVASRATCPRRQVGAILVDADGKLVSTGYNGPPAGMPHCIDTPCPGAADKSGDTTRCIAVHAEVNAIHQAGSSRRAPRTLYCSTTPCFDCAGMLITEGIREIVATSAYSDQCGVERLRQAGVMVQIVKSMKRPRIVCLCGSTKFKDEFLEATCKETWDGNIVLSVGFFGHADGLVFTDRDKSQLDELHKRKIDLADEVFVINVGGYVGSSTRSEINYAVAHGKPVRYLEEM